MWIIKVMVFLWPFIKDMVLGDKTLSEAIRDNKKKVALALMILLSLGMNFFLISRLIIVSQKYVVIEKENKQYRENNSPVAPSKEKPPKLPTKSIVTDALAATPLEELREEVVVPEEPTKPVVSKPITKPTKKAITTTSNNNRYAKMKHDFDKIQEREQSD